MLKVCARSHADGVPLFGATCSLGASIGTAGANALRRINAQRAGTSFGVGLCHRGQRDLHYPPWDKREQRCSWSPALFNATHDRLMHAETLQSGVHHTGHSTVKRAEGIKADGEGEGEPEIEVNGNAALASAETSKDKEVL